MKKYLENIRKSNPTIRNSRWSVLWAQALTATGGMGGVAFEKTTKIKQQK